MNKFSEKDDWKNSGEHNVAITLNVLYAKKKKYICLCFKT